MSAGITAQELQKLLSSEQVCLIDILLPEDFNCRHISGANNACVYEMVFLERIAECVPNLDTAIVVYDESGTTQAAKTAKEKLERAGYQKVTILDGGLQSWQEAGFGVEQGESTRPTDEVCNGIYKVDTEKSVLEWVGRNINNRHYGRIAVSDGEIAMENGRPVSGKLVLNMNEITNADIQDEGWRGMLIRHLKSDDFFDVEKYPTARFELHNSVAIPGATPGTPNFEISGSLTIKEAARSISFPAIIAQQEDGSLKAHASLDVDRTNWNVCYGSGKLYERLGMHLVNDLISIELFIVAQG